MQKLVKIIALLLPFGLASACGRAEAPAQLKAETAAERCAALLTTSDDVQTWIASKTQSELAAAFTCLPASTKLPLGVGVGTGSLLAYAPQLNALQAMLGSTLWGGKRFYAEGDGVRLLNIMRDSGVERYRAAVRLVPSIGDGRPTVVLDYRIDDSAATLGSPATPLQYLVDGIVHGIRDEIREIHLNGAPTKVYLGRAYLARQLLTPGAVIAGDISLTDAEFQDAGSWLFAANFFLDFRAAVQ